MSKPLHVVIVEDSVEDAELLVFELRQAGFDLEWIRVETEEEYLAQLEKRPDVVLSDYSMPEFNGLRAIELTRRSGFDVPFILVSGTVGEEVAVEAMKRGATDYVLKDRIVRLGQAVNRALSEKQERLKRKQAEEQILIQSHALEAAANAILITDRAGKILSANKAFCDLTGYALREIVGRTPNFLKSGAHDPRLYRDLWNTVNAGRVWQGEIINRRKDGSLYCEEMTITPVHGAGGQITHFIAVKQDATQRKKAEEELIWKTAFLEAQVQSAPDAILVVNEQARRILQNQKLFDLFKVPDEVATTDDDARFLEHVTSLMKDPLQFRARVDDLYAHPDEIGRDEIEMSDGTILDRFSAPVRDKGGKYYGRIWTFRDITSRRKLEEQFRQAQKMEAIGQLASGVAHDFNNILAVVQMQCDLMAENKNLDRSQKESLQEIDAAARRAASLTRQLLLFSRKEIMQPRELDLNQCINQITKMLRRIVGEDIDLQFRLASGPLLVHADAGMLDQVLMNLVVNSRAAMPEGGKIIIETSALDLDQEVAAQSPGARPGSFARLSVTDTGCGIPPENFSRIFEPFFTTKEIGKGTGLGLATVFGIVQQHQGWIDVKSEVGHGAVFHIYYPRQRKLSAAPAPPPPADPVGGHETILLVEDDAFVRMAMRDALVNLGYRILEAGNGAEAIEIWPQHREEIALLLTDLVMPGGMNGKQLAERLLTDNSKLKIIYASGYHAGIAGDDFKLEEGVNFLSKPFEAEKLAAIVRARLDR